MFLTQFISQSTHLVQHAFRRAYDYLLPPACVLCGSTSYSSSTICQACEHCLPILPHCCHQCAQILPKTAKGQAKCGACLHLPPPFDNTFPLFPYEFPIIEMIIKLKFQHQLQYAKALGEKLADKMISDWYVNKPLPDLIVPVPLHPKRMRERGFNQALEIVRPVAKKLGLRLDTRSSQRIKPTLAQSSLSAAARKQNIANAFKLQAKFTGLNVAVVDDVITTGSTVLEFCTLLKGQGASQIDVWCCARNLG